ncbi:MAG TPA: type II toxin-antitoxin system RelE/ParE family toxin [Candidatus Limnocylindrales bacterium]
MLSQCGRSTFSQCRPRRRSSRSPGRTWPALGRPLVDRVQASRFHNMKELRPSSTGATEIRMLFAFDPQREAIFLIAGDKSGQWKKWYQAAIPIADDRFEQHLTSLK